MSDVLVSLSTLIALKLGSTARASIARNSARGTAMSVKMYTSIVARFGSIMPAPFAIPTMLPAPTVARRIFG